MVLASLAGPPVRRLDPTATTNPRPTTRPTQRQPPTRRTQEEDPTGINEVARHLLTMSRDFTHGAASGI